VAGHPGAAPCRVSPGARGRSAVGSTAAWGGKRSLGGSNTPRSFPSTERLTAPPIRRAWTLAGGGAPGGSGAANA
jgi:hypothetical protein